MCVVCLDLARSLADGGGLGGLDAQFSLNADARGGTGPNGKDSFTTAEAASALTRSGLSWTVAGAPTTVTYAYRSSAPASMPSDTAGFSRFGVPQIAAAELAFAAWSDVAGITFQRVDAGDGFADDATILLGNYATGAEGAAAFAYLPGQRLVSSVTGDIWISSALSYNRTPSAANYGQQVMLHEIGHAIGLSHPAAYNASAGVTITYTSNAQYYEDSRQYSVMSYFSESNTGGAFAGRYASAPLMDDIAAVQRLYGANMETRVGDTVYGFNSTADRPWFAATAAVAPIFAVWDAGGTDTFDFSGYAAPQRIDLRAGHFSDVGGLFGNVSVALGVVIENANGGSGADVIIGNAAGNVLQGRGGVDWLQGLGGDDVLIAGAAGLVGAPDLAKPQATINGSMGKAVSLDGFFDRDLDPTIFDSTGLPHATVRAVSHGAIEWYAFTARAGASIVVDIDGATFDSFVYLYDAAGTLIASNDDAAVDPGSNSGLDSFLSATAQTAGVYYLAVNVWSSTGVGSGPPAGASYTMHVSVSSAAVTPPTLQGSTLLGGDGHDLLIGGDGADRLFGGADADDVQGHAGDDLGYGAAGADLLRGGDGADLLNGEGEDDRLYGEGGDDTLSGESGRDQLWGGAGADLLLGGVNDDLLFGEAGEDVMFGETGGDLLLGGAGSDILNGMDGEDVLQGELGADVLSGELGADVLIGGLGADVLIGGAGADRFVIGALGDSQIGDGGDLIVDFQAGVDVIDLTGVDANSFEPGDQAFAWIAVFTGVAGQATLTYDAALGRTVFRGDVNGDGQADVVLSLLGQVGQADGWVL